MLSDRDGNLLPLALRQRFIFLGAPHRMLSRHARKPQQLSLRRSCSPDAFRSGRQSPTAHAMKTVHFLSRRPKANAANLMPREGSSPHRPQLALRRRPHPTSPQQANEASPCEPETIRVHRDQRATRSGCIAGGHRSGCLQSRQGDHIARQT